MVVGVVGGVVVVVGCVVVVVVVVVVVAVLRTCFCKFCIQAVLPQLAIQKHSKATHSLLQFGYLMSKLKHKAPKLGGGRDFLNCLAAIVSQSLSPRKVCCGQACSPGTLLRVKLTKRSWLRQKL